MSRARVVGGALLAIGLGVSATGTGAVENDPLPVPKGGARQRAVTAYNDGVKLMVDKRYAAAQQKFEEALAADERLAGPTTTSPSTCACKARPTVSKR